MKAGMAGMALALVMASGAEASGLGVCLWSKLSAPERTRVMAAYGRDMGAGAAALEGLDVKLRAKAAACGARRDIPALWIQTIAGSEAVQASVAATYRLDRKGLDAAWSAAPPQVAACVRANARLAFYSNGLGCADPAAPAWLLRRLGLSQNQPAARQALYYVNARAIGEWGDTLAARPPAKSPG